VRPEAGVKFAERHDLPPQICEIEWLQQEGVYSQPVRFNNGIGPPLSRHQDKAQLVEVRIVSDSLQQVRTGPRPDIHLREYEAKVLPLHHHVRAGRVCCAADVLKPAALY